MQVEVEGFEIVLLYMSAVSSLSLHQSFPTLQKFLSLLFFSSPLPQLRQKTNLAAAAKKGEKAFVPQTTVSSSLPAFSFGPPSSITMSSPSK